VDLNHRPQHYHFKNNWDRYSIYKDSTAVIKNGIEGGTVCVAKKTKQNHHKVQIITVN
jgi:hypothetical protein